MSDIMSLIKQALNPQQQKACCCLDNMILTACPGSGKTRVLSYRLAYLQEVFQNSCRLHIAITYTSRAAEEIYSRIEEIGINSDKIWVGTIHQFCMHFIVRPYAMYNDRLHTGFRVIDETVQIKYKRELAKDLEIQCQDWELNDNPKIMDAYRKRLIQNREIDFDDILAISERVLVDCSFVAENISSIIASIQIDEYQDTNEKQYNILSLICKARSEIIITFIGDPNQAIYDSLGGVAKSKKEIESLFNQSFVEAHLSGCYRSCQRIINYYCKFAVNPIQINSINDNNSHRGVITFCDNISKRELTSCIARIIECSIKLGVTEEDICVVAPQWKLLNPIEDELRKLLPHLKFNSHALSLFKTDVMNPFYLLCFLSFNRISGNERLRIKYATDIINIFKNDYALSINSDYDCYHLLKALNSVSKDPNLNGVNFYEDVCFQVLRSMNIDINEEHILLMHYNNFLANINFDYSLTYNDLCKYFDTQHAVTINTIHGIKGKEYNTVIAFGLLNGFVPHWDVIFNHKMQRNQMTHKLLYVLCSRAKENLFLFSEIGRKTHGGNNYSPTSEIASLDWDYDDFKSFFNLAPT